MKTTGRHTKHSKPRFDEDGYQIDFEDLNGEALPDLTARKWTPLHGGARKGAGRKPSGRVPFMLRLNPKTIAAIRTIAKKEKKTLSEVVEEHLVGV